MDAANDNPAPPAPSPHLVPIIGYVGENGAVTIVDAGWRPAPAPGQVPAAWLFPNDPREA